MKDNAYIIFSREPVPGQTKTRLMPYYTSEQCAALHCCFLKDFKNIADNVDADIFVYYHSPSGSFPLIREIFGPEVQYFPQRGESLNLKMHNAITDVLEMGYSSCILTGTDIPALTAESVNYAFRRLDEDDAVIGRTVDGGYHLIGLHKPCYAPFAINTPEPGEVYDAAVKAMTDEGLKVTPVHEYPDIDFKEDIDRFRKDMRTSRALRESATGRFIANTARISIIIPTYNEESTVVGMQDMLRPYLDDAEIIFVDGGSTDRTCELISHEFKLINSAKGRAIQLNMAAEEATGDILFFLHCDSILPDNVIGEIRSVMADHVYGCWGVKFDSHHIFMITNKYISNFRAYVR
ncbi:MAG: TIGR04282 family arsenosugar biosynthesis glycosyltransferase, partial [Parasporobacterium sp.]|nr:TIGR04282 family arsenosugar biosynthesis glycosyltransferase [Parasporobacterium sp.]